MKEDSDSTGRWTLSVWPRPAPILFSIVGAVFGSLYIAGGGQAEHILVGALVGLVVGVARPLFRYRVAGALIVSLATAFGFLSTQAQHQGSTELCLFIAGAVGFSYGVLFWGDPRWDVFSTDDV